VQKTEELIKKETFAKWLKRKTNKKKDKSRIKSAPSYAGRTKNAIKSKNLDFRVFLGLGLSLTF